MHHVLTRSPRRGSAGSGRSCARRGRRGVLRLADANPHTSVVDREGIETSASFQAVSRTWFTTLVVVDLGTLGRVFVTAETIVKAGGCNVLILSSTRLVAYTSRVGV